MSGPAIAISRSDGGTLDHVGFAVLAAVAALAREMSGMELVVVPAEMERPNVQRPAEAIARARDAVACPPVVVVAVQSLAANEREDAADRLLDDLPVDDLLGGESLGVLDRRKVGLVEADAEDAEVGVAVKDPEHLGQPARGQIRHDEVGVGYDDRIARRRIDADLQGRAAAPWVEILVEKDQLVEARAVRLQPVAYFRAGRVVDDRDPERRGRPRLEGVDHLDQMVETVVGEDYDVGGFVHEAVQSLAAGAVSGFAGFSSMYVILRILYWTAYALWASVSIRSA